MAQAAVVRDLLLDLVDLPFETRIYVRAQRNSVAEEISASQYFHHFLDLFLADKFHSWSGHFVHLVPFQTSMYSRKLFRSRAVFQGSSSQYFGLRSSHLQTPSKPVALT